MSTDVLLGTPLVPLEFQPRPPLFGGGKLLCGPDVRETPKPRLPPSDPGEAKTHLRDRKMALKIRLLIRARS